MPEIIPPLGIAFDSTPIPLTPDSRAVATRKIQDMMFALQTLARGVGEGKSPSVGLAEATLRACEFNLADLAGVLGVKMDSAADVEARHAALRKANARIREVEAQLGNQQAPEHTQLSLQVLEDRLYTWWSLEGFGTVSEVAFRSNGCKAILSCNPKGRFGFGLLESDTPVSDKAAEAAWHESLQEMGYELTDDGGDLAVLDCDASRKALFDLIRARLPSAQIMKTENLSRRGRTECVLRGVEIYIYRLPEILTLPQPVPTEG